MYLVGDKLTLSLFCKWPCTLHIQHYIRIRLVAVIMTVRFMAVMEWFSRNIYYSSCLCRAKSTTENKEDNF